MQRLYLTFLRGIAVNRVARLGTAVTTTSFLLGIVYVAVSLSGGLANPYFDLLIFLCLPAAFVGGLVLVAMGWLLFRREHARSGVSGEELLRQQFGENYASPRAWGSKLGWIVLGLTTVNLAILGATSLGTKSYMDQPEFCGTTCHVMNPEWTAYQDSPHRNVACVECHVGEGAGALIQSKIRGLEQMYEHALGLYNQPIPTPVHTLSPVSETCETCHAAAENLGDRVRVHARYGTDERSTPAFNTVSLKIGAGQGQRGAIHWHAAPSTVVEYASAGDARREVYWIEVIDTDGTIRRFENQALTHRATGQERRRRMDCTDCHNRVAHVFDDPETTIDARLESGELDAALPFLKARALYAVTRSHRDRETARAQIRSSLESFYLSRYPDVATAKQVEIERAVVVLQRLYERNIHREMDVAWNTYTTLNGHRHEGQGCFRCHQRNMVDSNGTAVGYDCTLCHSILAHESPTPFEFQRTVDDEHPLAAEHRYLQQEYLGSQPSAPPAQPTAPAEPTAAPSSAGGAAGGAH